MSNYLKSLGLLSILAARGVARPTYEGSANAERHTIRLHADGHVLPGMELLASYDGERTKLGTLVSSGGVEFRTPKGKKFFVTYGEFSFVINEGGDDKKLAV